MQDECLRSQLLRERWLDLCLDPIFWGRCDWICAVNSNNGCYNNWRGDSFSELELLSRMTCSNCMDRCWPHWSLSLPSSLFKIQFSWTQICIAISFASENIVYSGLPGFSAASMVARQLLMPAAEFLILKVQIISGARHLNLFFLLVTTASLSIRMVCKWLFSS